jgi:hypothetical protein
MAPLQNYGCFGWLIGFSDCSGSGFTSFGET